MSRMNNQGLDLITPRVTPVLDPYFRPAALARKSFEARALATGKPKRIGIALEQADGSIDHFHTILPTEDHAAGSFRHVERLVKFLLWARGGFKIHIAGSAKMAALLSEHFNQSPTGQFDAEIMGNRIYEQSFSVVSCDELPPARSATAPLGRHWNGCRIGFDLGGSDRKVAAVIDGKCVFSEEIVWNPVPQKDPEWHFQEIMDGLKRAAAHLPRVDAIGGSSAGVYVNNRVKVASLFRGVPPELFQSRVKDLFLELKSAWNDIPFEIANDGEVTALAGSMSLRENRVLGLALGTSTAAGYVNSEGNITQWLNELAFVPVDYHPSAAADEWSGDRGCGVQYFSQQAVNRLLGPAGIEVDPSMPLPERLKEVQQLMAKDDHRARKIYETIGAYLGYTVAHFEGFYDLRHVLVLGRVTTGTGGEIILTEAHRVLALEFPELAEKIRLHMPDEKEKRHGQAMAAASLPALP